MNRFLVLLLIGLAAYSFLDQEPERFSPPGSRDAASDELIEQAYQNRQSNLQVAGDGVVAKVLPDDRDGSRHQKFILKLASGRTVLVAHNIDLAPRVQSLKAGDRVEFYGEYEWNDRGGVIHWTHHDPGGRHPDGWLRHGGKVFQ